MSSVRMRLEGRREARSRALVRSRHAAAGREPVACAPTSRNDCRGRTMNRAPLCRALFGLALLLASSAYAEIDPAWTTAIAPFRIAGNLYYVGSKELASYLIVTPQGDILIDSNLETSVPQIRQAVEQLGQRFTDIRILLIS